METEEYYEMGAKPRSTRAELESRLADIDKLRNSGKYNAGAKKALEQNMKDIRQELAELDGEAESGQSIAA